MILNFKKRFFGTVSIICAVLLLLGAVFPPSQLSISAAESEADQTVVFTFEDAVTDSETNLKAVEEQGVGYFGWGGVAADDGSGNMLYSVKETVKRAWATSGGFRLNNADGVYSLEASSDYIITMKVRVISSPSSIEGSAETNRALVNLCYGAYRKGTNGNYVDTVGVTETPIVTSLIDSDKFVLYNEGGQKEYDCSQEWHTVTYHISTPAILEGNTDITLWSSKYYGFNCQIDDISVTKLAAGKNAAVLIDSYSQTGDVVYGETGSAIPLSDISDRATEESHIFKGWYLDEARTVKAEAPLFGEAQYLYSAWTAPVNVTFINTLDNSEQTVTGIAGENFEYPADPVDPESKKYFMGWYTTAEYTEEHTSGILPFTDIILYSYFEEEIAGLTQDFENYTYDGQITDSATGILTNKSPNAFFKTFTKVQEDGDNAVKFVWDSTMVKSDGNPNSYNAASRYNSMDNSVWLGNGLENGEMYEVTFSYKIEKAGSDFRFAVSSASNGNHWSKSKVTNGAGTVKQTDAGKGWLNGSIVFTTDFTDASSSYIYLSIMLTENADAVVYIDDVSVRAVAQPGESAVVFYGNNDEDVIIVKGKYGQSVSVPSVSNISGAEFEGWYGDSALENVFAQKTFRRKPTSAYAKWGAAPLSFKDYPYDTSNNLSFGQLTMAVVNESSVGVNDDYALRFRFDGDTVRSYNEDGEPSYLYTRYNQRDHIAPIGTVKDNTVYEVTFYYRTGENCETDYNIRLATAASGNIWALHTAYESTVINVSSEACDWTKITVTFASDLADSRGNCLYVQFGCAEGTMNSYTEAFVDNFIIKEVTDDVIYFHSNASGVKDNLVYGVAGEAIDFPTVSYGRREFLGWYTDKECTIPFIDTTIPHGSAIVYAKWSTIPEYFDEYKNASSLGKALSVKQEKGIGYDDNHVLYYDYDADGVYSVNQWNKTLYNCLRYNQRDNSAMIGTVEDGVTYRLTYYYKVKDSNIDVKITPVSAASGNIWLSSCYNNYGISVTVPSGKTDWVKVETYFVAEVKSGNNNTGNSLFLQFNPITGDINTHADILVDNVLLEKAEPLPYVIFTPQNEETNILVRAEEGSTISYPENPVRTGYTFGGWYTDTEYTTAFSETVFSADTAVQVYAKWNKASSATYDFEKYYLTYPNDFTEVSAQRYKTGKALSGSYVIKYDRKNYDISGVIPLGSKNELALLDDDTKYVVSVAYYIDKEYSTTSAPTLTLYAGDANCSSNTRKAIADAQYISIIAQTGKWQYAHFIVDSEPITKDIPYVSLVIANGMDGVIYIDDIKVEKLAAGTGIAIIKNDGTANLPTLLKGKVGRSFAASLPQSPTSANQIFKGYYTLGADGAYTLLPASEMVFGKEPVTVYARFLSKVITHNFDDGEYINQSEAYPSLSIYDHDYEVYDASAQGNSYENVTSGKYSLHRKGTSMYFENALLIPARSQIANDERYTVTFKVKMTNHLHTDGAIKLGSARTAAYPWAVTGNYHPVIAIADLADGQWHTVSYTFNSIEAYLSIQTPGYCELFIDDITITLVDENTPASSPVAFTEYVQAKRSETGEIIATEKNLDINNIIDESLSAGGNGVSRIPLWATITLCAVAVIVIAGLFIIILLVKKKKKSQV